MNAFVNNIGVVSDELNVSLTTTANGAISYASSLNANLDFFRLAGSSRGVDLQDRFKQAFAENEDLAVRCLLWLRDVRGGAGERQSFRNLLVSMEKSGRYDEVLEKIIPKIPEYGRFDDLLIFKTAKFSNLALDVYKKALMVDQNGLAAKWAPREKSRSKEDRMNALALMKHLDLSPKQYRKLIVSLTNVVETPMCKKDYSEIKYSAVPSVATRRYTKAFYRNDVTRYTQYLQDAIDGKVKVNASAIFPHDILANMSTGPSEMIAEAQWKAMPNYLNDRRILPVIDVSSSMNSIVQGSKHTHMHIAISLGMYVAEKNTGAFKNVFLTFSGNPELAVIPEGKSIKDRYNFIKNSNWCGSTNLQKSFELILNHAVRNKVPKDQMPEIIIIPSDMQFNQADRNYMTNYQAIRNKYENAGYDIHHIVFWQLNGGYTDAQVRANQKNVSMISGFSPSILKAVLGGGEIEEEKVVEIDPIETMKNALLVDRYNWQ